MSYDRDTLGFLIGHDCPHCGAALYLSPDAERRGLAPICLNACQLPVWQYRLMQRGLREAQDRVAREDATVSNNPSNTQE